jgi:hypothetical protein
MTFGRKAKGVLRATTLITVAAFLLIVGAHFQITNAQQTPVILTAGGGAPEAGGIATLRFVQGVLVGEVKVDDLPAQPFASGHFYGVWFVRADGSKAFLGALINDQSIIFSEGGDGEMGFRATKFTTGPADGSPITFGPAGTNVIIVLIENKINGLTPSPIGAVPGPGVAVSGSF